MPLESFKTPFEPAPTHALVVGPVLECAPPSTEPGDHALRIRANRTFPVSCEHLFETWTRRSGWDSWMRLRARSRSTLSPYHGGAFRLELAEGPTIHVITGTVNDIRPPELLSFSWVHHNTGDQGSIVDVTFQSQHGGTEATEIALVHRNIHSRREASWLMRLWSTVLVRLGDYAVAQAPHGTQRITASDSGGRQAGERERRASRGATFARSA